MSLSTILKDMETNRPNADLELTMGSPNTFGARLGLKKAATEAISRLKNDYRKELMSSTVFIVVTGGNRNAFSELASSDAFGCFSTDPEDFFKDLALRVSPPQIKPSLYGREGVRNLFNVAQNVLFDKTMELDIDSYPPLYFNDKYNRAVNTMEDFVPLIREAIVDQVGSEIVGINAIHSIVNKAIEKNHSAVVTPLILNTADENFALDLYKNLTRLTPKVFLVVAGKAPKTLTGSAGAIVVKTVNEETVGEALTTIRSKVLK